ncbi:MAG: hypothetical protein A2658_01680 [Candidatus Yonathbacteria bacterium RIFCSPHIGHO2_01_FULL_44_19]|nr:MAG: hypothetical protein A2658_01680 [Candidatus Yonathbacteria bacterium RIFCSPHIGHO2_01_FULL_44_19]
MNKKTRTTTKYECQHMVTAPTLVSCSAGKQSALQTRGLMMIDVHLLEAKKRVRALKLARPFTIWGYCRGRHTGQFLLRGLALLLMVALNAYTLGSIGTTAAYYLDGEMLKGNNYVAGSVDFILSSTPYSSPVIALGLDSGAVASRTVSVIPEQGASAFWYHASSTNFGADLDFCGSLTLASSLGGVQNYSGLLTDFASPATTTLSNWQFDLSTNGALYNKACTFDIEFTAWQERHNVPSFTEMGYHDVEKETNKIASQGLRLNKVYYDVLDGSAPSLCSESLNFFVDSSTSPTCTSATSFSTTTPRGSEVLNEWVEVYNQTNVEQDITGWSICDDTSCDVIPETAILPPFGYAIITATSSTLAFWNISPSFSSAILSDGAIGDGLNNDNDMLMLQRPDGMTVDQMNYGQSSNIGWANYNSDVWIPGVLDVSEGGVLARNPNGYDTDQPSDWSGYGVPTITLINPNSDSGGTWNFGASHDIFWSAINPNGSDTDLLIDIYLIKDVDDTRTVTPEDTATPVVIGTDNDGHYYMEASSGFSGYFWVKVVVTGSENPLLNDADYSGKFYGSSLCKSPDSKSRTSGCGDGGDDDHNDDDEEEEGGEHDNDNEHDNKDRDDDEKQHDDEEEHDRVVKDSSEHYDEELSKESHENSIDHDDNKDEKEILVERITESAPPPEESIPSVTIFKKEEELVVVVEESTSKSDKPDIIPVAELASFVEVEPDVVVVVPVVSI